MKSVNEQGTELRVDLRRRVQLGKLAAHDRYMATVDEHGTITLVPVMLVRVVSSAEGAGHEDH